jgi:hypothetical protein
MWFLRWVCLVIINPCVVVSECFELSQILKPSPLYPPSTVSAVLLQSANESCRWWILAVPGWWRSTCGRGRECKDLRWLEYLADWNSECLLLWSLRIPCNLFWPVYLLLYWLYCTLLVLFDTFLILFDPFWPNCLNCLYPEQSKLVLTVALRQHCLDSPRSSEELAHKQKMSFF